MQTEEIFVRKNELDTVIGMYLCGLFHRGRRQRPKQEMSASCTVCTHRLANYAAYQPPSALIGGTPHVWQETS